MMPGKYTLTGCPELNQKCLSASRYKNLDSTKKRRKIRRDQAKRHDDKNEEKEGESYWCILNTAIESYYSRCLILFGRCCFFLLLCNIEQLILYLNLYYVFLKTTYLKASAKISQKPLFQIP